MSLNFNFGYPASAFQSLGLQESTTMPHLRSKHSFGKDFILVIDIFSYYHWILYARSSSSFQNIYLIYILFYWVKSFTIMGRKEMLV